MDEIVEELRRATIAGRFPMQNALTPPSESERLAAIVLRLAKRVSLLETTLKEKHDGSET